MRLQILEVKTMITKTSFSIFALLVILVSPAICAETGVVSIYNELQRSKHLGLD